MLIASERVSALSIAVRSLPSHMSEHENYYLSVRHDLFPNVVRIRFVGNCLFDGNAALRGAINAAQAHYAEKQRGVQ